MVQRSPAISDSISSTGWDDVDTEKAIESEPLSPIDENYSNADQVQIQTSPAPKLQLEGWRLPVVFLSIFIGLFLSFLDTSIVAVALATIASKFHSFADSSWVFSSYLLTYMAFSIILARLSDFIGLKTVEALSMGLFLAFSGACGGAQNMTQLIIFRSIQGIGGSGLYSMCMVISLAAVPVSKISEMATYVSVTQAVAVVLGPILSGVITQRTDTDDWRWIFYLNLPLCSLALLGLLVAWPKRTRGEHGRPYRISFKRLEEIDFLGSSLLLVASVMVLFLGTYPL
jgi:MFS family permease